jgi:hypothetical protein
MHLHGFVLCDMLARLTRWFDRVLQETTLHGTTLQPSLARPTRLLGELQANVLHTARHTQLRLLARLARRLDLCHAGTAYTVVWQSAAGNSFTRHGFAAIVGTTDAMAYTNEPT